MTEKDIDILKKDNNRLKEENLELKKSVANTNRGMQDLMAKMEKRDADNAELRKRLNKARDLIDHLTAVYV